MDLEAFERRAHGELVPISGYDPRFDEHYDHAAFVPAPLPDELRLTPETYERLEAASNAVVRLDQAVSGLPNPQLLNRPVIRREAQSTSALEGTFVAFTDVLEADFVSRDNLPEDVREVYNSVLAAEYAFQALPHRGLSQGLLQELQRMVVSGTRADGPAAGWVRDTQVFIGARGRRVPEARFVPPPPGPRLEDGFQHLLTWHTSADGPVLLKAAVAHYQFETLHPFTDGNGRVGRLLAIMQLVHAGLLHEPVLNLSPWLETYREDYQDHLLQTSRCGDFDPWVQFFCSAVEQQALEQVKRIDRLVQWKVDTLSELASAGMAGVVLRIAEDLIGYPFITPKLASEIYGRTYQACNTAIARLVERGVLTERTGKKYNRIFSAPDVLKIVEE